MNRNYIPPAVTHDPSIKMPEPTTQGLNAPADLLARSQEFDQRKVDYNDSLDRPWKFKFGPDMHLVPTDRNGISVQPAEVNEWAFGQLSALLGRTVFGSASGKNLPKEYLWPMANNADYQPAVADLMNVHLSKRPGELFIRTYNVAPEGEADRYAVRAALSTSYAPVSNTKMLTAFSQAYSEYLRQRGADPEAQGEHRVIRSWVGPDDFLLKTMFYDITPHTTVNPLDRETEGGRPPYGIGVMMSNSEVGAGSIKVCGLIQRGHCQNSIVIDAGENSLDIVHRGSAQAILDRVKKALVHTLDLSQQYLADFLDLDNEPVEDFHGVITRIAADRKWDVKIADAVRTGAENRATMGALINGLTFAAHTEFKGQETVDVERFAGQILADPAKTLKSVLVAR